MNRERSRQYLAELGIQTWQRRLPQTAARATQADPVQQTDEPEGRHSSSLSPPASPLEPNVPSLEYCMEPTYSMADHSSEIKNGGAISSTDERADHIAQLDWDALQTMVSGCTACALHSSRTQTVFGVGSRQADWLIVGEAPGADEDRQGEPFVGRAGKLLDAMLLALGMKREQVFIANILKCRPPNNRDPAQEEMHCCWPFLDRQIALLAPRIILAIGRIAAQSLLQTETPVGKLRGRVHRYQPGNIPLIVSYHPAYLLRSPREKRKSWDDLQLAQRTLQALSAAD